MIKLKELKCSFDDGALTLGEVFPHLGGNGKNETITKEQIEKIMQMEKETGRQGEISDALKRMGIARVADIPATRFDEVVQMVQTFMPPQKPKQVEQAK